MSFNARETVYRGTRMRSRLEASFAQMCDRLGWQWQYEPVCFAGTWWWGWEDGHDGRWDEKHWHDYAAKA